jgi:hypothetical protein
VTEGFKDEVKESVSVALSNGISDTPEGKI